MIIWDWYFLRFMLWEICGTLQNMVHSNPTETSESACGTGMGLSHVIPIPDPTGNIWNFTKHVAIP